MIPNDTKVPAGTGLESDHDTGFQSQTSLEAKADEQTTFALAQDAFGDESNAEVKYKVLSWWQCGLLMIAESISLGVLSLPAAVAALGLVPAVILIIGLGLLATYTGYVLGQFKWKHPQISNMADAGEVLLGAFGRELLCAGQTLFLIFLMAGHLVTFTVALNSISGHATCSMVFGVVGLVVSLICSLPRTMKNISWLSILSFISILSGVFVTMISVGITKPGTGAAATTKTDLYHGFSAVSNIVFSYAGHIGYYSFMGELKDARDFPKALYLLQAAEIGIYLLASLVIYRYAGADVASPALGSAPSIVSKIAYGLALPAILISGVVAGHVASKLIYMRISHGTDRMHKRDFLAIGSWIAVILTLWVLAWIIAEAIPGFNSILTLISALFASWFSYGLPGFCWLHMNAGSYFASGKKILLTLVNASTIGMAFCICGLGVYVAGKDIHSNHSGASFSCANNA